MSSFVFVMAQAYGFVTAERRTQEVSKPLILLMGHDVSHGNAGFLITMLIKISENDE